MSHPTDSQASHEQANTSDPKSLLCGLAGAALFGALGWVVLAAAAVIARQGAVKPGEFPLSEVNAFTLIAALIGGLGAYQGSALVRRGDSLRTGAGKVGGAAGGIGASLGGVIGALAGSNQWGGALGGALGGVLGALGGGLLLGLTGAIVGALVAFLKARLGATGVPQVIQTERPTTVPAPSFRGGRHETGAEVARSAPAHVAPAVVTPAATPPAVAAPATVLSSKEINVMSDTPDRPQRRDQPVQGRAPLWPWLIAGGGVFVGLLALVVGGALVFVARSERQAQNQTGAPPSVSTPAPAPQPQPQPLVPPKPTADADYFNDQMPNPPVGPTTGRGEYTMDMDEVGNAKVALDIKFPAQWMADLRQRTSMYVVPGPKGLEYRPPTLRNLLRIIQPDDAVLEDIGGAFTDHEVQLRYREIGVAKYREGRWVRNLHPDPAHPLKLVKKERSQVVTLRSVKNLELPPITIVDNVVVKLPPGAHDIEVTEKPNQLWYRLPKPAGRAPAAEARMPFVVQAKPHLLGALAKQYGESRQGDVWAARGIFRNDTADTFTNYRVRFRIPDFAGWSDWQACDSVFPGQAVVDTFRPKLDHARIGELTGPTEVSIEAEFEYTGPNGLVRASSRGPTRILPINDGVFSDVEINFDMTWLEMYKHAPRILASFVVPNDPVMKEVVDLVCRSTGVALPIKTDKDALTFVKGVYLLMRGNMKWEPAKGGVVQGMPYQHLKYGRDVLHDHAGTCVNTSIFFASVMEAAGLDPFLYVIQGHAFAAVLMPESKQAKPTVLFIETTGCGKGTLEESAPFDVVRQVGSETIQQAVQGKMYLEVNIRYMRQQGVVPPELPAIKGGVLADWGVRMPKEADTGDARAGGAGLVDARATVKILRQEANVTRNGKQGAVVHVAVNITNATGRTCEVFSGMVDERGEIVRARDEVGADPDRYFIVRTTVRPDSADAAFADVQLFVPYDALPSAGRGQKYIGVVLVSCDGRMLNKPDRNAVFDLVR